MGNDPLLIRICIKALHLQINSSEIKTISTNSATEVDHIIPIAMPLSLLVLLISVLQLQLVASSYTVVDTNLCDGVDSYEHSKSHGIKFLDALEAQKRFIATKSVSQN